MPLRFLPAVFALCSFTVAFLFWFSYTPATAVALTHVVISEVQISGDGATPASDEFVEFYNPASTAVVMENWKLTRKNSAGSEANLVSSFDGVIPARGFFLIGHGTGYNGSTSLDVPYSASSNALTNNYAVLLYDGDGVPVDKVGFGSAPDFETTVFGTNPSANGSIERKASAGSDAATLGAGGTEEYSGNGEDTDVNANDWIFRTTSNPQNSTAPLEPVISLTPTTTLTPTPSVTPSPTPMSTSTPTLTPTSIPTSIPTVAPTVTVTPTPSSTLTPTLQPTPTAGEVLGDSGEDDEDDEDEEDEEDERGEKHHKRRILFQLHNRFFSCKIWVTKRRFFKKYIHIPHVEFRRHRR